MWAMESWELSKTNVYSGISEQKPLPESYIDKNQDAIEEKIVLGGLRLANVIKTLFGSNSKNTMAAEEKSFL